MGHLDLLGTKKIKSEIQDSWLSHSLDPVSVVWIRARPDFGRFLAAHPFGDEQRTRLSGDEDAAKLEMMVRCGNVLAWLKSTSHEGKYTYSHILEIILGLGPHEKLCFVQDICAENRTPRSTWICKTEDHCKRKACLLFVFSPPCLETINQTPKRL